MSRVAIFVDAGYLFARSSVVLTGVAVSRTSIDLHQSATISKLRATATVTAAGASLLRIYWYDGMLPEGPSAQQRALAYADNVKLRLGVVNTFGQQKGVDSLIVTDLVELARNHAISDAVLLSGDEDMRIGVQIAQSYGVRVHLIGIGAGQESQSRTLMQEADTRTEWSKDDVNDILMLRPDYEAAYLPGSVDAPTGAIDSTKTLLDEVVKEFVASLLSEQLQQLAELDQGQPVPSEHDHKLLAISRSKLTRKLDWEERAYLRDHFKQAAREAAHSA